MTRMSFDNVAVITNHQLVNVMNSYLKLIKLSYATRKARLVNAAKQLSAKANLISGTKKSKAYVCGSVCIQTIGTEVSQG